MSTAHGSGPMSQQPADEQTGPTGGTSRNTAVLIDSVARLRRILTIATGVLVALELLWCVGGGMTGGVARPTRTFPVAAVATALLLASRGGFWPAWCAPGWDSWLPGWAAVTSRESPCWPWFSSAVG